MIMGTVDSLGLALNGVAMLQSDEFLKCGVVVRRGSRCCKTGVQPRCRSLWVVTFTQCPTLPSARISRRSGCQGSRYVRNVGGTCSVDVFRRGQLIASCCICRQRSAGDSFPRTCLLLACMYSRRGDGACGGRAARRKSRRMVEELL